jgi:hypothetical protein
VLVVGYLPIVVSASHVLMSADQTVTNASPWNGIIDRLLRHDAWRNAPDPLAPNGTLHVFFYAGMALVLALGIALGWHAARRDRPDEAVGASVAAYPVAAEYAYPWYAAWGLPVFATGGLSPFGAVVWIQSVVMLAALKLPLAVTAGPVDAVFRILLTYVAPVVLLAAFVVTGFGRRPQRRTVVRSTAETAHQTGGTSFSG